jgi:outer membrane protease
MRNIAVFGAFVTLGFCLLCSPLFAQSPQAAGNSAQKFPYAISVSPLAGILWGQGEEQVYWSATADDLISQLLWDIKPLWYTGAALDFSQREPLKNIGFFITVTAKFGIPMETGSMEDRDWMIHGVLTNYSWHHNNTSSAIILDLAAGISIPLRPLFALRFSLGFSYLNFSWAGYDGYRRYGNDNVYPAQPIVDSTPKKYYSGVVISYSQEWLLLPFGFSFAIMPGRLFSGSLFFSAGPVLSFTGEDTHHTRSPPRLFLDSITGGYTIEPGAEFLFSPFEHFSLGLRFSWRDLAADPHGKSYYADTGDSYSFIGNTAGGLFQTMDFGLNVTVSF